jgi:RNA polymerase sigma factor (sigma-70 family)
MKTIPVQTQIVSADTTTDFFNRYELYKKYVIPYSRLIYWMCIKHSSSRYYLKDNYQEVLAVLFNGIHTYNPERGDIKTWLCAVAKHTVWDLNEKYCKYSHCNTANEPDLSQIADDYCYYDVENSSKCDYLINYRLLFSDDILDALEQLSPILRETLLLYLSGYKLREIADISYKSGNLKIKNIETVKSRLYYARNQMRRLIDEHGNRRRV